MKFQNALKEAIKIREVSVPEGDKILGSLRFQPPAPFLERINGLDPFSEEYVIAQLELLEAITGVNHDIKNEGIEASRWDIAKPSPFFMQPVDVGYWLMIFGNILMKMALPKGSKILEVGAGAGGLTEFLARSGLDVTAVEIRKSNCDFISNRLSAFDGCNVNAIDGDICGMDFGEEDFDCIVFFESFHHIRDNFKLLKNSDFILSITVSFCLRPNQWLMTLTHVFRFHGGFAWMVVRCRPR